MLAGNCNSATESTKNKLSGGDFILLINKENTVIKGINSLLKLTVSLVDFLLIYSASPSDYN